MNETSILPLAITMGDPAGCGPQITAAAWRAVREDAAHTFAVIGAVNLYREYCNVESIQDLKDAPSVFTRALPVLDIGPKIIGIQAGKPNAETAPAIISSIETAVSLARNNRAAAVVTNPINKSLLYEAGFKHQGHTEFLASLCTNPADSPDRPIMMLVGGGLRVALATIHMPLIDVAPNLNIGMLVETAQIVDDALRQDFDLASPRLAFTGLNPHAGETGNLGKEEIEIINPAAEQLRQTGVDITDARPADSVFAESLQGQFDAVIAMTHDQGLIPVKTLDFWGGVNTTLGLPIVRTSPDHGTAYDAARSGKCRSDSLIAAIKLARQCATFRKVDRARNPS